MITLITGVPGAGKTVKAVMMVRDAAQSRPVYVAGITGLRVEGVHEATKDMLTDLDKLPDGALLVVDEAQTYYGQQTTATEQMQTHRHRGLDIVLVTQGYQLLHRSIKPLIGAHYHYLLTPLGERRELYWDRQANPNSTRDVAAAQRKVFELPRDIFELYSSATVGLGVRRAKKTKAKMYLLGALVLLCVAIGATIWAASSLWESASGEDAATKETAEVITAASAVPSALPASPPSGPPVASEAASTAAPVKALPEVDKLHANALCVASSGGCNCYTRNGLRLDVAGKLCRKIASGWYVEGREVTPSQTQQVQDKFKEAIRAETSNHVKGEAL